MDAIGAWFLFVIFLNSVLAGVVAYAASQRGRSAVNFFFLSFVFSFLVGILVLLAIPARTENVGNLVECPKCLALIPMEASKCRFCQSDVEPKVDSESEPGVFLYCGKCQSSYEFHEVSGNKCPTCKKGMDILSR
jgi:hypothetical protein